MGDNNEDNHWGNNQPWLARYALDFPSHLHNLPRHLEKLLPKFDPETSGLSKITLKIYIGHPVNECAT
jgi:hypothetical protein